MFTTLIDAQALRAELENPQWAVIDCRFELQRPAWGAAAWAEGHIPHAQYADLERDLSAARAPGSGRHPLPQPQALAQTFGRWGIDAGVQVVAYDQGPGMYAARLWWLLRWLGHTRVAVLDGGLAAWVRAGLPLTGEVTVRPPRHFLGRAQPGMAVTGSELAAALGRGELERGETVLVDARGADRFAGENETLDPVAGHVPGARNHPFTGNQGADGRFLDAAELRRRWQQTLAGASAADLVAMCGSGVTACHNLLALEVAGLPGARLYGGSWSEWIGDPGHPVARGR
ncbi:MAG: sulfurtransferase [Proteobacteria bacterium]|nr:sulfurtransferase [Pseudomonadota bacterium]